MRLLVVLLALFPAASAAQAPRAPPPPKAQSAVDNAMEAMNQMAAEMETSIDNDPCLRREDNVIRSRPYRDCVDLLPPERMRGVWYFEMEESGFLPDATTAPAQRFIATGTRLPEYQTWLDIDAEAALRDVPLPEGHGVLAVAIEFVGRRARNEGQYGHGDAPKLVVVDRVISIRPLRRVRTWVEFPMCVERCGRQR